MQTLAADDSPTHTPLVIRREHLYDARLTRDGGSGEFELQLPLAGLEAPQAATKARAATGRDATVTLRGEPARRTVSRAITDYNTRGASQDDVRRALGRLTDAGDAERYLRDATTGGIALSRAVPRRRRGGGYSPRQILGTFRGEVLPVRKYRSAFHENDGRVRLSAVDALAFEMALHEASERAALGGELAALDAAWREAEEIAAIADSLPHDLSDRIRALRG